MGKSNGKSKMDELDTEHELPPAEDDERSGGVPAGGPASAAEASGVQAELQKLKAERDTLLDRLARAQAEFENARKRAAKEQQDFRAAVPSRNSRNSAISLPRTRSRRCCR